MLCSYLVGLYEDESLCDCEPRVPDSIRNLHHSPHGVRHDLYRLNRSGGGDLTGIPPQPTVGSDPSVAFGCCVVEAKC